MKRKSLLFGLLAVLSAVLIFTGCANPADGSDGAPGAAGEGTPGVEGPAGPSYFSGPHTTAGIQDAIDSGAPVVFAGVTQNDAGTVIIPAGRNVKLVGTAAYTTADGGALVVEALSSVTGSGTLVASNNSGSHVIVPAGVSASANGSGVVARIQDGSEDIKPDTVFAVKGPVTISGTATSTTNVLNTELTGTLYVLGDVEVKAAITGKLNATGKATFNTAPQTALAGLIAGSVESSVAITGASNADITVTGELKTTATAAVTLAGTGALDAGSLDLAGNLTTGTGAVTVKGASVLGGNVSRTSGAYSFGGDVTIANSKTITLTSTDKVTLKNGAAIKVGSDTVLSAPNGDVVITPVTGAVLTATEATKKIAVGTAGIAFTGTLAVSGELEANAKDITVTSEKGILAINAGGKVTTKGAVDAGAIILGGSTNGVTLTGAGSWTAGGSTVYLTQTDTDKATIYKTGTAAATLNAVAGGTPTITVLAGSVAANVLTLGPGVTIDVKGTNAAKVGAVVLTGDSKVGTLKLVDATSKVITGNTGGSAYTTGVKQTKVAVVSGLNTTVIVTGASDKIVSVTGGSTGNGTIAAATDGDISIDGNTTTTDADS
jgi:hypothetical protein